ncbi:MAG: YdcF family protein [Betaproteobacteria bacterium]|nr:YdcF family protein [Betaproteobacteria bacterium]
MLALVKTLILPPANLLLLAMAGLALRRRYPRWGYGTAAVALGLLYLISTPIVSSFCLSLLEEAYVDPLAEPGAQAIVALGGGTNEWAPEYGTDVVNSLTMTRIRYAAKLQRASGKPLLVSGGSVRGDTLAEAQQMRAVLVDEMNVPVRWTEERSVDTFTNAVESYRILAPLGITTVYLVTHAWHMPRARLAFAHAGFTVIPAATAFSQTEPIDPSLLDFLPRASALMKSYYFWHEVLGYLAYSVRVRL